VRYFSRCYVCNDLQTSLDIIGNVASSSAVAERPRDASCLSVVSFNHRLLLKKPMAKIMGGRFSTTHSGKTTGPIFVARCYASAVLAVMRCLSVCLTVTFVDCIKMNKQNLQNFSSSGNQAILVFPHQSAWQYSDRNSLTGASNAGGVGRNRDSEPISWLHCELLTLRLAIGVINMTPPDHRPISCDTYRW